MPSNWNEATGTVETLMERYQRESSEQQKQVMKATDSNLAVNEAACSASPATES